MPNSTAITVTIATTAELKRESHINRAIESVLSQQGCLFQLHIIINGCIFDLALKNRLEKDSRFTCYYLAEGSYPKALVYARSIVTTAYFCFLDDDDELLPSSLSLRLKEFSLNPTADVVISNGLRSFQDGSTIECHPNIMTYMNDPLAELLKRDGIWLGSCAGLYKSAKIPNDYFEDYAAYGEWTYLAFKLALNKNIRFTPLKGFKINVHNESLSHSRHYLFGLYQMHQKVLLLALPKHLKRLFEIKTGAIEHCIAGDFLEHGQQNEAWRYHFKSLKSWQGVKNYLFYSRFLIIASLKRFFK